MATATPIPAIAEACAVKLSYHRVIYSMQWCSRELNHIWSLLRGSACYAEVHPHRFCLVGLHKWWLGRSNIYIIFIFGTSLLGQLSSAEDAWPLFLIFVTWLSSSSAMMLSTPSTWPTPHPPYPDSSARCPLGMTPHPLHPGSSPLYLLSPILHPRHPGSSPLYSLSPIPHPCHLGSSPLYLLLPKQHPHHISEPSASVVERSSFDLAKPSWHSCNRPSAKPISCGLK